MSILRNITAAVVACICASGIYAQDVNPNDVWKKNNYTNLGYSISQTGTDYSAIQDSKFSFFITKGNTYYWPKSKPWFGMLKVGLDIRWLDMQVTKFKTESAGWEDWDESDPWDDDDNNFIGSDMLDKVMNLGCYNLTMGAFGFGPSVGVSPFAKMSNGLRHLRASLYFHYQPAVTAYILSQDGETEFSWAYTGMWDFGGKITYRFISFGVEGRWGNGKFKPLDFSGLFGDDEDSGTPAAKINRKFANTRIYVGFTF